MGKQLIVDGVRQVAGVVPILPGSKEVVVISTPGSTTFWTLPKGGREVGEEDAAATALREATEEAGIHGRIVGELVKAKQYKKSDPQVLKQEIVYYEMIVERVDEHWLEESTRIRKFLPVDKALDLLTKPGQREALLNCSLLRS